MHPAGPPPAARPQTGCGRRFLPSSFYDGSRRRVRPDRRRPPDSPPRAGRGSGIPPGTASRERTLPSENQPIQQLPRPRAVAMRAMCSRGDADVQAMAVPVDPLAALWTSGCGLAQRTNTGAGVGHPLVHAAVPMGAASDSSRTRSAGRRRRCARAGCCRKTGRSGRFQDPADLPGSSSRRSYCRRCAGTHQAV